MCAFEIASLSVGKCSRRRRSQFNIILLKYFINNHELSILVWLVFLLMLMWAALWRRWNARWDSDERRTALPHSHNGIQQSRTHSYIDVENGTSRICTTVANRKDETERKNKDPEQKKRRWMQRERDKEEKRNTIIFLKYFRSNFVIVSERYSVALTEKFAFFFIIIFTFMPSARMFVMLYDITRIECIAEQNNEYDKQFQARACSVQRTKLDGKTGNRVVCRQAPERK